jgi:hypothetical protein
MRAMPSLLALAAVLAVSLGLLAGCGDDEDAAAPAAPGSSEAASGAADEAADATAQSNARAAQTAVETYAAGHGGSYEGANPNTLSEIEPVTSDVGVEASADSYTTTAESESGNTFTIERSSDGSTTRTCTEAGVGDCPENGEW